MQFSIPFVITGILMTIVAMTVGGDMLAAFDDITDTWAMLQDRSYRRVDTRISGPIGLSVSATTTVQLTLANTGAAPLGQFSDWDVIFEVQKAPGLGLSYLAYSTSSSPATSEWIVEGTYLNAASSTPEIVDPGVFNPGEEMVVVANPSTSVTANTYDRATFVTPNGTTVKVIFHVLP